jgi:PEGA domain
MKRFPSIIGGVTLVTALALGMPAAAQHRQRGSSAGSGDRAVPRGDSGGGSGSAPQPVSGGSAATPQRASEGDRSGERASGRQRGAPPTRDVAVARSSVPPSTSGPIFVNRGYYRSYYPWGYGGYGFGGYDGGYYDPWFYGSGYGYGRYGGGYYPGSYYQGSYYSGFEEGSLRIKVKPKNGSVYVDGYFAGQVDEFDGVFQRLHVEPGPHRIEIRADGYAPLSFEIRVPPGRTVNYSGELRRLP